MIPESPREFKKESREGEMFHALENLPHEYYVVHSLKTANLVKNSLLSREADFVIFHPEKGLLVLECKGGYPRYENGKWYCGNGAEMSHDGPYRQAADTMYAIEKSISYSSSAQLLNHCRRYYGVWFPSVSRDNLRRQNLPPEADMAITLTMEDLADPLPAIEKIFSIHARRGDQDIAQKMTEAEVHTLLTSFICPRFDLAPSILEKRADEKVIFHKLLAEQKKILDFLVDQPIAVINGAAGTGKTWVALEKARRHADEGEEVLFLCYNRQLKDFLEKRTSSKGYQNIHFYSIDGFACAVCNTPESDFPLLNKVLQKMFMEDKFPYQHIIIDEGQDFGQDFIEENGIMQLLCDIVTADESKDGTFYVFYDRLQTIQGKKLPKFIVYNVVGALIVSFTFIKGPLSSATQRFLNYEMGVKTNGRPNLVFNVSLYVYIVIAVLIVLVLEIGGQWFLNNEMNIPPGRMSATQFTFQISLISLLFSFARVPYDALIISNERLSFYALLSLLEVTLKLLNAFSLSYFMVDKLELYALNHLAIDIILTLTFVIYTKRKIPEFKFTGEWDGKIAGSLLKFTGWGLFGSFSGMTADQGVNIVLNIFCGVVVNASMGIAQQINNAVCGLASNFQTAFRPQIMKSYASGDWQDMNTLIERTSKFSFLLIFLIAFPFCLNCEFILDLWLKEWPQLARDFCILFMGYSSDRGCA